MITKVPQIFLWLCCTFLLLGWASLAVSDEVVADGSDYLVTELGIRDAMGMDTSNGFPVIQALRLVSSERRVRLSEVHGILLMLQEGRLNHAACEALVSHLNFYDDRRLLSFQFRNSQSLLRLTYMYDGRLRDQLAAVQRPPTLSRSDCPELVSNFDFSLSHSLAELLSLRRGGGPWLVAVDPPNKRAAVLDLGKYQSHQFLEAMELWTEILQDPARWRRSKFFEENFADLITRNEPLQLIRLPEGFLD